MTKSEAAVLFIVLPFAGLYAVADKLEHDATKLGATEAVTIDQGPTPTPAPEPAPQREAAKAEVGAKPRLVLVSNPETCPPCRVFDRYVWTDKTLERLGETYKLETYKRAPPEFNLRLGIPYVWFPDAVKPGLLRPNPPDPRYPRLPLRDAKRFIELAESVPHDASEHPEHPSAAVEGER